MRIFRFHLPVFAVAISFDAAAAGTALVRCPAVGEMTSAPAVMGRRYWTELRSGPYADPAWVLGEKDRNTGLSDLPLFRDAALFHGTGVHDPTNPQFATWRKVAVRNGRFRWTVPAGKLAVFEIADRKERYAK